MVDQRRGYDANRDKRSAVDGAVAELAGRQHGVVARAQLLRLGLTKDSIRRRVERKRLLLLHPGVYAVGHLALTVDSRRMAAVLAYGRGALLSHRAAGALHALVASSTRFEVTIAGGGRRPRDGIVVHRSRRMAREDRDAVRGIPVTSVARTIVDLAGVLDEERLGRAIREAEIRRVFDLAAVEGVLARLPSRAGARRLARVLDDYRPDSRFTRSEAERRFLDLCERHGLPAPSTNVWVAGHELDAFWADAGVAVEVDGASVHRTRAAFQRDRSRDRSLAAHGIQVVRLTWNDLADGQRLAAELAAIRGRRGARRSSPSGGSSAAA